MGEGAGGAGVGTTLGAAADVVCLQECSEQSVAAAKGLSMTAEYITQKLIPLLLKHTTDAQRSAEGVDDELLESCAKAMKHLKATGGSGARACTGMARSWPAYTTRSTPCPSRARATLCRRRR